MSLLGITGPLAEVTDGETEGLTIVCVVAGSTQLTQNRKEWDPAQRAVLHWKNDEFTRL